MKKLVKALVLALVIAAPVAISAPEAQAQNTPHHTKSTQHTTKHTDVKAIKHKKVKNKFKKGATKKAHHQVAPTPSAPKN